MFIKKISFYPTLHRVIINSFDLTCLMGVSEPGITVWYIIYGAWAHWLHLCSELFTDKEHRLGFTLVYCKAVLISPVENITHTCSSICLALCKHDSTKVSNLTVLHIHWQRADKVDLTVEANEFISCKESCKCNFRVVSDICMSEWFL